MNAYLLVGGSSRRMGRSKVDLPFGGSTFLRIVAAAAAPVFDRVIAVQRTGGEAIPDIPTLFESEHADAAPVFGVARALEDADGRCFVIAIDYPLLTADVLRFLRRRFEESHREMLVPMWRGRAQLLCGGYSSTILPIIRSRIESGRFDLRGLIDEAAAEIVGEEELRRQFGGEPLINVNTPAELEEAEALYARS
ncbi:MAG: molybdenum cofactor guanylyltransferase [Thermoanaerobaculia bacterium]